MLTPFLRPIALQPPHRLSPPFGWVEHIPFAMALVDMLRPRTIVELGTHTGNSYCAFCQAVKALDLPTKCYAIDTWQGDPQAGFYGAEILEELRVHHDPEYGAFSRLIPSTFDEALAHFAEESVDILHIDGYHTYEGARGDFYNWLPKLAPNAIVLFHDINVRESDFGVHRLWDELRASYRHFSFLHGNGLGVLALGNDYPPDLQALFDADETTTALVRQLFYTLGHRLTLEGDAAKRELELLKTRTELREQLERYDRDYRALQRWITERDAHIAKLEHDITLFQGWISERDAQLQHQQQRIFELEAIIEQIESDLGEKQQHAQDSSELAEQQLSTIQDQRKELLTRDGQFAALTLLYSESEKKIAELESYLASLEATERTSIQTQQALAALQESKAQIEQSLGWKMLMRVWKIRSRVFPYQSFPSKLARLAWRGAKEYRANGMKSVIRRGAAKALRKLNQPQPALAQHEPAASQLNDYQQWIAQHEPDAQGLRQQALRSLERTSPPLISIVTPVYNTEPQVLAQMIRSVIAQSYPYWELWLVNASPENEAIDELMHRYSQNEARINVLTLEHNLGIIENTNAGIAQVCGDYVAFVDHDDLLTPFALYEVAEAIAQHPDVGLFYSDSDLINQQGTTRSRPLFKPDWSPIIMLSSNYITHLSVVRSAILRELGGLSSGNDGAQDWDLVLRISDMGQRIHHIPKILYHWRDSPSSTATDIRQKPYAMQAQLKVIRDHLLRRGVDAQVYFDTSGYIRVAWPLSGASKVSIIIPSRNLRLVQRCVGSLQLRTGYRNFEIIIADTTADASIARYYERHPQENIRVIHHHQLPFNYSAVNNVAVAASTGDILLFLNDDTEAIDSQWLAELVRWAEREEIGVVGPKLLFENRSIQHAGVVIGLDGFAGHPFAGMPEGSHTIYGCTEWYRNYSAVTGACLAIRREVFNQIGGFDEALILCGSDIALCLAATKLGYQVVYTPFSRMLHLESTSRGSDIPPSDFALSYAYYQELLRSGDPYYNPNLSYWSAAPQLSRPDEQQPIDFVHRHLEAIGLPVLASNEKKSL
ncbi:glycosyltransferase [Chloroflexia bacterium SDU3-3]|nr:glycosyltransferase [Chloroflexia bacterium SDU3-3]